MIATIARAVALAVCGTLACALLPAGASAAPLLGSDFDSGDGDQLNGLSLDWEGAAGAGRVTHNPDPNAADNCFVGGNKENAPRDWAFNTSAGGCIPGKSNVRGAWTNPESTAATTFSHFAFWRNGVTGNSFLTFELNQGATTWTNSKGTTIPCRQNGDVLLAFEVGGSSLNTTVYKWVGDGTGPPGCPNGASGTFVAGNPSPSEFQAAMNVTTITNYLNPSLTASMFAGNSFGEAAINLPAVLRGMGESGCFGFVQMQVHSRSSSSISSALIDYTAPTPVYMQSCSATGTKYRDTNGSGTREAGEPGLAGFTFYADLNDDGVKDAGEPSGTSDADGFYRILDLPPGTYKIREVAQPGETCTEPDPDCHYERTFTEGGNSTGNDFGSTAGSTASGTKFNDLNGNGVEDAGEPGLSGYTFYVDYNGNGSKDAGEPEGSSDGSGDWTISGIVAGTYDVREVVPAGSTCTTPNPCRFTRTFTSGSSQTGMTFGNVQAPSVSGNVFEDSNGNGTKDGGEPNLSGWRAYLDLNGNGAYDAGSESGVSALTDSSGNYSIAPTPGTYTVRVVPASSSWYCTQPSESACHRSVTVTSGSSSTGNNFGFTQYATVSGTKTNSAGGAGLADFVFYVDYNGNGQHDPDDANPEPSATSAANGTWSITEVKAGSYAVREVDQTGWTCAAPSPCRYDLTITSGGTYTGNSFSNTASTQRLVSGTVYRESSVPRNQTWNQPDEPGLSGFVVYSDSNNNSTRDAGETFVTTRANGTWGFNVPNGNERVRVELPSGWACDAPSTCLQTASGSASVPNLNFGVYKTSSSISGNVFQDSNGNGAKEDGEPNLSDRTVFIDANNNDAVDVGETQATTNGSGNYTFSGLTSPSNYNNIKVLLSGWTCSTPSPCSYSVSLQDTDVTGRDFGLHQNGTISGTVVTDSNANGAKDDGEAGISGRTVYADLDNSGTLNGGDVSTTSNGSGAYTLSVAPRTAPVVVRQVVPGGWTASFPGGDTYSVTVTSGSTTSDRDFGSWTTGTISGTVYSDANMNGNVPDVGDLPLLGRTVYLDANDNGQHDGGETTTTTDVLGAYSFTGLTPATYEVRQLVPAGWTTSYPALDVHTVTLASGATSANNHFGSYLGAEVSGNVFEDLDANGQPKEAGEPNLAGQTVYLDASPFNGQRDAGEPSATTDGDGNYSLTGVEAGTWRVRVELQSGWSCDSPSPCSYEVTLGSGQQVTARNFGLHTTGSISGHLFTDSNGDGVQQFGENDQPGRTVFVDLDDSGTLDGGEPSATTDGDGNYTISGLEPRSGSNPYRLRQVLPKEGDDDPFNPGETYPSDWQCSSPSPDCWHDVTLTSREAATEKDFSSWTGASFTGRQFEDLDGDGGFPEDGEPGIEGRTVYLDLNDSGTLNVGEPSETTDADGKYEFADLEPRIDPSAYRVRSLAPPAEWSCSYPAEPADCEDSGWGWDLNLEASEAAQELDFGTFTTGTVSGQKFNDLNADGVKDDGEDGLEGWTIYADLDGDGEFNANDGDDEPFDDTDADGNYFLDLAPGDYEIREVAQAGWTCSAPDTGVDCVHEVTVESSGEYDGRNFGNWTDDPPELSIDDVTIAEGNFGPTNAIFTVSMDRASSSDISFDWATSDDSATQPADYTQSAGDDVTIAAGSTTTTISVPVNGDTIDEADETFEVTLSDPQNTTIADGTGVGTITDDDPAPSLSIDDITVSEGDSGTTNATFTVSLSAASGRDVSFDWASADDTATEPADYTSSSGNDTTISAGSTSTTITVAVKGDTIDELDETFDVTLSDPTNATIADGTGVGTITDDDTSSLSIDDVTVAEGNSGTTNANFTVSISTASDRNISFDWATSDDSATQPADYTQSSGNDETISAGSTSTTITVPVKGDTIDELDETFDVILSDPTNATITDGTGVGTITDDDTASLSIDDVTVTEGDVGTTNANFTVSLSTPSDRDVTFDFATADGTATEPADYTSTTGNDVTISAGSTSTTITVPVKGDTLDELDETFDVNVSDVQNAAVADGTGVGTITDDDTASLSIDDISVTEGDVGTTNATFTVSLDRISDRDVTFDWATSDDTATQPADYIASSGDDVTISAGSSSTTISVPVVGDIVDEGDETFDVTLSDPQNATVTDGTGVGTIVDDESIALSIDDVTVAEGDSGTTDATFTVSLNKISVSDVSFDFATSDDTATEPGDYTSTTGNDVTISAGSTSTTVTVPVKGDTLDELDETFDVTLSDPTNAAIGDGTGVGTITDDDPAPSISIDDITVTEGDSGTTNASFTVSLDAASGRDVGFDFATADGSATEPADYVSTTGNDVTIAAGDTTATVTVPVKGDTLDEIDETFDVALSDPTNATIGDDTGTATITDDDTASLSIDDVAVTEGDSGTVDATFTVSLSTTSDRDVGFDFATSDDTATAPADYTQSSGNDETISAGSTSTTITVPVKGDTIDELDETFDVTLSDPTNATIGDGTGVGTITDDDGAALSIDDVTVAEGDSGTTDATFTVSLSGASASDVTFDFATSDDTATEPDDYTAKIGNDVTISAGDTTATVTISVKGDLIDEADETFEVTLSDLQNTTIADGTGVGTITDDDPAPELSIDDVTVAEGNFGPTNAIFTVSMDRASSSDISFDWATSDDSATEPADYTQSSGDDVTISAGSTSTTISVPVNGDTIDELDETFDVTLSDPTNAAIADGTGVGTITDDDPAPGLSIDDVTVAEGDSGTTNATFTVSLSAASGRDVSFDWATSDDTATQPADYTSASGNDETISAGSTSTTITVPVKGDTIDEPDETFDVTLSDAQNSTINDGIGVGTITDDDTASLSIDDVTVAEGDSGTTDATFTVSLSTASDRDVSFDWATANGTATQAADYTSASGDDVTISAGSTSTTVTVQVKGDTIDELDETFDVTLSDPTNAAIADGTGTGTITDDDTTSLSIDDITVTEGSSGTTNATFTLSLDKASDRDISFDFATADGSATQPGDYVEKSGNDVTISAGSTSTTVTVQVKGDTIDELDETFTVALSDVQNALVGKGSGTATITDDDTASLSVNDIVVTEGNSGTANATFTVRLSTASDRNITFDWATSDDSATQPADYTQSAGDDVTISAGSTSKTITVPVKGDTIDELDETFTVALSDVQNALVGKGTGTATITDDDGISISVDDITVTEGGKATFTITLDRPAAKTVTVNYETRDGTATQPGDYTRRVGIVTFAPGETTKTVTIDTVGDQLDEPDEKFTLQLSDPTNATLGDGTAEATITDDDPAPQLSVGDITVTEGGEGCFELTLDRPSGRSVQVSYQTGDGSAIQPDDYDEKAGTLTFAPGETTKTLCVETADDSLDEADEKLTLKLSDPINATLGDGTAEATITDDDEEAVVDPTSTRPLEPSEIPAGCPVPYAGAEMAIAGGAGAQNIEGSSGQDILRSFDGPDQLVGRADNDCLIGDGGPDRLRGKKGTDWQIGGPGRDMVQGDAGDDWLSGGAGKDRVKGAKGSDKVFGNAGNDKVSAGDGDDLLKGGPGDDRMFADGGDDWALAGPGDDVIFAGPGNDRVRCGPGEDKVVFLRKGRRDRAARDCERVIMRGKPHGARSTASNANRVEPAGQASSGQGSEPAATEPATAVDRDDVPAACPLPLERAALALAGAPGSPALRGEHGDDILVGFADQTVVGGDGSDCLLGSPGDNELRGGPGDDTLVAGGGTNVIDCGPGDDRVVVLRRDRDEVADDCEVVIVRGEVMDDETEAAGGRGSG